MILRKLVGILLLLSAAGGIIFAAVGLVGIWHYRQVVTQKVVENLVLVDQALNTTQDGLSIVGKMVQTTAEDVTSLQTTTQSLAQAIHDTNPMLETLISLTKDDFPAAVGAAQTSLASAQGSARLIDSVLATLTSIPFSPVAAYKPEVPLHTALAQVSDSLNTLRPSLGTINTSLADGKTNLGVLEMELKDISVTTQGISTALGSAQSVIDQYQAVITQLKGQVEGVQRGAPTWITATAWILSFVLAWLLIAQLGLGAQGLDMLRGQSGDRPGA